MSRGPSVTMGLVRDFVGRRRLALAGASRSGKKFGSVLLRELKARGYDVVPVHPSAAELEGLPCARDLSALRGRVDGLVVVTPPSETTRLVAAAADAGIGAVWIQQGAESEDALAVARARGLAVVHGHCLLMYLPGVSGFHGFHRVLWRLLGKLPADPPPA